MGREVEPPAKREPRPPDMGAAEFVAEGRGRGRAKPAPSRGDASTEAPVAEVPVAEVPAAESPVAEVPAAEAMVEAGADVQAPPPLEGKFRPTEARTPPQPVTLMDRVLSLDGVVGIIAIIMTLAICGVVFLRPEPETPDVLCYALMLILGFFFGTRVRGGRRNIE